MLPSYLLATYYLVNMFTKQLYIYIYTHNTFELNEYYAQFVSIKWV